jgi:uncharacterized protein YdeI (YjbR/CyaY-like superfamily)
MNRKEPKVDEYIQRSAEFAKPVLLHLRDLVHKACPGVEEKIKWGFPHFDYKGTYVSMASFKEHCAFNFWKSGLMKDPYGLLGEKGEKAMGNFGRIRKLADLPTDAILMEYLIQARKLNDEGKKVIRSKPADKEKPGLVIPPDLKSALKRNKQGEVLFEKFTYSQKNEYILWIEEAKTTETREKRVATTVEWSAEGKTRNWKYKK